jgi:hypothetical protein
MLNLPDGPWLYEVRRREVVCEFTCERLTYGFAHWLAAALNAWDKTHPLEAAKLKNKHRFFPGA